MRIHKGLLYRKLTRVISFQITAQSGPFENHRDAKKKEEEKLVLRGTRAHSFLRVARFPSQRGSFQRPPFHHHSIKYESKVGWLYIGIFIYANQMHRHSSSPCPTFSYINIIYCADPLTQSNSMHIKHAFKLSYL